MGRPTPHARFPVPGLTHANRCETGPACEDGNRSDHSSRQNCYVRFRAENESPPRTPKSTAEFRNGENLANSSKTSEARTSPVAFEVTRRRRRRDFVHFVELFSTSRTQERRGWDSNPRATFAAAGFQDRCLQPLGHPSIPFSSTVKGKGPSRFLSTSPPGQSPNSAPDRGG